MREWKFQDAEDFRAQVHSLLLIVSEMGMYVVNQNPEKASRYARDAHDVIHLMERRGYVETIED